MPAKFSSVSSAFSRKVFAAAEMFEAQERDRSGGISGWSWRVLQRLAAGGERAERLAVCGQFGVEECASDGIVEARDHGVADGSGGLVVAQFAGRLPGVDAGFDGEGVIVEDSGDAVLSQAACLHSKSRARGRWLRSSLRRGCGRVSSARSRPARRD